MGLFLESWLSEFLAVALVVVAAVYTWYSHRYSYWIKKGVSQAPTVIPFGNMARVFLGLTRLEFIFYELYNRFRDQRYLGVYLFSKPGLLLIDRDIIRLVLVKEFDAFSHRNVHFDEKDPLNYHLFNLNGGRWKRLRAKMTPAFTTGKLKMMCQTMQDCGRQLVEVLEEPAKKGQILEMREIAARFTTDIIASVGFGLESNSQRNPDAEFRRWGRKLFEFSIKKRIARLMYRFFPFVAKAIRLQRGDNEVFRYFQEVVHKTVEYREQHSIVRNDFLHLMMQLKNKGFIDEQSKTGAQEIDNWSKLQRGDNEVFRYFQEVVHKTVEYREQHSIVRNDFLHLMMQLKNKGFIDEQSKTGAQEIDNWKFTIDDVAAQSILFYAAGFETSSTTMSFGLYELALNPDVQKRLHEEVDATLKENAGQLTYEAISSMKYLDKVVAETLRKHPPAAATDRRCARDFQLPDGGPLIEKGTPVFIPIYALHHDLEYYPEPQRFDPERFSEEQKATRHPYVYMPFGEGPRNCIGMRLGLLQAKIGLAYLMSKYEVRRCEETTVPLQYSTWSAVLMSTTGIQLKLAQRK